MPYDYAVHVHLWERHFVVEYDADGVVLRIKERKIYQPGTYMARVYDASWWSAKSHVLGSGNTMPKQVIAAAEAKTRREDASRNATP
jgi:hypothetical protein